MNKKTKASPVSLVTPKRRGRPPKAKIGEQNQIQIDWEKLAKQLQGALESSIEENKVLFSDNAKLVKDNRSLMAIVHYLESRLARANNPV